MKIKYIVLILCTFCNINIFSQTFKNKEFKFSISFPENQNWQQKDLNKYLPDSVQSSNNSFLFSSDIIHKTIMLKIGSISHNIKNPERVVYNPKFHENMKQGLKHDLNNNYKMVKYKIVKEIDTTFCNTPCYELICTTSVPTNNRLIVFIKDFHFFILNAISNDTTEVIDKGLNKILSSFEFN